MKHTRVQYGDWGLSTTVIQPLRPTSPVYAISLGPDDEAGCVILDGLPGAYKTARVTPECPWLGTVDGDSSTLLLSPYATVDAVTQPAFQHRMDIILWHEKGLVPSKARAPLRKTLRIVSTDSGVLVASVRGRQRVSVSADFRGVGTSSVPQIFQYTQMGAPSSRFTGPVVLLGSGISNNGTLNWSPNRRPLGTALTVGSMTELHDCDAIVFQCIPAAAQTIDVVIEAWD